MRSNLAIVNLPNAELTQEERIYKHLMTGQAINPLYAWTRYGVYRLAAVIHILRHKHGLNIINEGLDVKNQFGENCHVAKYRLALPGEQACLAL